MIPSKVFQTVAYGFYYCRGARFTANDGWRYTLSHELSKVLCDADRTVSKERFEKLPRDKKYVDIGNVMKEIRINVPLSLIPDSIESDWEVWDEY